jgi:hypothetical protein
MTDAEWIERTTARLQRAFYRTFTWGPGHKIGSKESIQRLTRIAEHAQRLGWI